METAQLIGAFPENSGHGFGNITISGTANVHMGDRVYNATRSYRSSIGKTEEDLYDTISRSLLFDRVDDRMLSVRKPLPRTCEWLFKHESYQCWEKAQDIHENNGFLWIRGKPGCGKSTLLKAALERARRANRKREFEHTIAYYFFNARAVTSLEKSSLGLYRFLTYQLLLSSSRVRNLFMKKFKFRAEGEPSHVWAKEELQDFLGDVVESEITLKMWFFIDALDEAEREDDMRQMVSFLVDLANRSLHPDSLCELHICLTSRHYPYISIHRGLSLTVEDQPEHDKDIDTYVRNKLNGLDSAGKDELRANICRKSANIFLWVVLVVEILNRLDDHGTLLTDMQEHLNKIPSDLDKLFSDILTKSTHDLEETIILFQWTLFALRALKPEDLYLAIKYSSSRISSVRRTSNCVELPTEDRLNRYILNCSRGLVEVTSTDPPVVQFIHETVRDILLDNNGIALVSPTLSVNLFGLSHDILKVGCLQYISTKEGPSQFRQRMSATLPQDEIYDFRLQVATHSPFIHYAVTSIFRHADLAQSHGVPQQSFLQSKTDPHGFWRGQESLWWMFFHPYHLSDGTSPVTLLYFLVQEGLLSLTKVSLKLSNHVNKECGGYGSALQAACVGGDIALVQELLANGANTNYIGGEYKHAVLAAIETGNTTLIPILMQYGAHLSQRLLDEAFLKSLKSQSLESVAQLLALGADPNMRCFLDDIDAVSPFPVSMSVVRRNVLHLAVYAGNERLVQMLLDAGADVNAEGFILEDALKAARFFGHANIVRKLLDAGAEVRTTNGYYKVSDESPRMFEKELQDMLRERGAVSTSR